MYTDHPDFPPLPDDAVLWRYMGFTKLLSLLDRSALFFCRADKLGDPFEGSISSASQQLLLDDRPNEPFRLEPFDLRQVPRRMLVNCWHKSESESEAMWRLYAKDREGIAIKTVSSRFKEAFVDEQTVYAAPVQYRDYQSEVIPFGNAMLPYFFKRLSFQHEREVRALIYQGSSNEALLYNAVGCYCEVGLTILIEEIVVAPFAENWFVDLVRSVSGRYGLGDRVRESELSSSNPIFGAHMPVPDN